MESAWGGAAIEGHLSHTSVEACFKRAPNRRAETRPEFTSLPRNAGDRGGAARQNLRMHRYWFWLMARYLIGGSLLALASWHILIAILRS